MELSHLSAIAMKPWRPPKVHFALENVCHTKEFNHLGSSCINCLKMLQYHTLSFRKQHDVTPSVAANLSFSFTMNHNLKHSLNKNRRQRKTPFRGASFSSLHPCKATNDDSRSAVTGESILMNEQSLERELRIAIEQENYDEAARIRDRIRALQEGSEASVLAANARFYNAFRTGDLSSMQDLWAKGDNVCCVHPGAGGISGYDLVMRSWEYVWVDYEFPLDIEIKDVRVHVRRDVGYVTCMELVRTKGSSWGRQFATNVFEKIDGQWHICIHHASPVDL